MDKMVVRSRKTVVRFFTIADWEEEERWLREQHRHGWRLARMTPPCFYELEACEPEDVIYRLDYKNNAQTEGYLQMASDFGWEYIAQCMGWLYFRRPADTVEAEGEDQLFSDSASRAEMVGQVVRTRLLPLAIVFLSCVMPGLVRSARGKMDSLSGVLSIFFGVMFVVYTYLIVYCGMKLKRIRDRELK